MKKIRFFTMLVFGILACGYLMGQDNPSDLWLNPASDDFATIQQNVENYYADKDKNARGSGYKQWKRWEYIQQNRLSDDGRVINYTAKNFDEYQNYVEANGSRGVTVTYGQWSSVGPTYFVDGNGWNGGMGRVNCITFHPSSASIFWVGCPSGGLWKTTNGGTTFTPQTDGMPRIGVSGLAVNYNNTNIMYLLSGDGDGGDVYSIGVLKTTNGGVTWSSTGLTWAVTDNVRAYKILMHPSNPAILFVVCNAGIFKTTDSGNNWTQVRPTSGTYVDIEFNPGNSTIMYTCRSSSFYRSTNTGDTWTLITSGTPSGATRMAIGVTPDATNYVYIFAGPPTGIGSFVGLYRSFDGGLNFGTQSTTPNILGYSSTGNDNKHQTTYDLAIAIHRDDYSDMVTGGINCWKNTSWGQTGYWTLSSLWDNPPGSDYTHADIHALEVNPLNGWLYCGSDGGIFRSTDFGDNWTDLSSGLAITQSYRIAGYEPNYNLIINGTQDNGSNKWTGGTTMEHVLGADGMDCMIDHSNSNVLYNTTQEGNLNKSTNGGDTYSFIAPVVDGGPWVTPLAMDPNNAQTIYGGWYGGIRKSTNGGSTWSNIGYNGTGALAVGTSFSGRVYASAASSNTIYRSDDYGATFTNVSAGLPGYSITFIAVNPDNSLDVFVTFGGFGAGQKVYASSNGGGTWTNISGTLPNIPVNCIAYEDNNGVPDDALYIGTDVGIYYRDNDIGDWIPFMNGLPATMVFDLEINEGSNAILAGTYGRGFWRSSLYSDCPGGYVLTPANDPSSPNYTGFQLYEASSYITSTRVVTGGIGTDVTYRAGSYVKLLKGFNARAGNEFHAVLGPCSGTAPGIPPTEVIPVTGTFEY